jgi:hypothetical protein
MAKEDPSTIRGEVAGNVFASAAYTDANKTATAPVDSVIFPGRHPNVNPFDPTTPAGNPPPLAPNSAYED